ncbi:MAG: alpha/beta fold hydrolase [Solirubrobacteraceae bacterium]
MTAAVKHALRPGAAVSVDGTKIGYLSLGEGRGLIIVGGALSSGSNYLPLAERLAGNFEVHVMDRRGRPRSGPQRPGHSIEEECADLIAVAEATGSTVVFGHSFGGLVALETARRRDIFELLYAYEPGVPIDGGFDFGWLDGYQQLLHDGDRRGAFASMVKHAGFAPRWLAAMPPWYVRAVLRLAIRGRRWEEIEPLLDANLVEHRILAALDAPTAERFSTITARTVLLGGAKSPGFISGELLAELGQVIPDSTVMLLPGLGHTAPEEQPGELGTAILAAGTGSPEQTVEIV